VVWVRDAANRDLRQLPWHRHRLVQMRTRVMNQLHVVALNEGLRRKKASWRPAGRNELESLKLAPWASLPCTTTAAQTPDDCLRAHTRTPPPC